MKYNILCFLKSYMCYLMIYLVTLKKITKDNKGYIYNFDGALADNGGYFHAIRGFIRIEYKKLSNNIYSVKMPIKNNKLFIRAYIDINLV